MGRGSYSRRLTSQRGGMLAHHGLSADQSTTLTQFMAPKATLEQKLDSAKNVSRKLMDSTMSHVDPYINDHGQGHVERVADSLDLLRNTLEDISITRQELARFHTEEETTQQDAAVCLHDVGRGHPTRGLSHAIASGEFVRSEKEIPFERWERERIARFVELHSDRATRELFGTEDLPDLVRRGILTREEAYLAGEVRLADAMDLGAKRVKRNTQGEPMERVIERINRELPHVEAKARLSHIYGHMAIKELRVRKKDNEVLLNFELDGERLTQHGADVAHRVKDILRDVNTTFLKGKYSVGLASTDLHEVKEWYDKYGYIFADELRGTRAYLGRSTS